MVLVAILIILPSPASTERHNDNICKNDREDKTHVFHEEWVKRARSGVRLIGYRVSGELCRGARQRMAYLSCSVCTCNCISKEDYNSICIRVTGVRIILG